MVGDQQQLPPVVLCPAAEEKGHSLGKECVMDVLLVMLSKDLACGVSR